jgi:hypothetical protein
MAASLVAGAVSGTTTVQGMPNDLAPHATPCAMFPALAVYTPFASRSGDSVASRCMAFVAPRSLKEPIGCRHSSLSQISAGASTCSRTNGDRRTVPEMRARAALISSRVLGASVGVVMVGTAAALAPILFY